ncbi:MAG: POTRA domain-containing protein, partial [Bdellovibrionales bacterium]
MKRSVLLLLQLTLSCGLLIPFAWAQSRNRPRLIADINVSGNRSVPTGEILAHLKTKKNKEYRIATLEEDVRHLTSLGSFR